MSERVSSHKKGELLEVRQDLISERKEKRKDALKKVISFMTMGKDVSSLFPDVIGCLQNEKLEIKKLVYLYLMNYAKFRPQMALMAVNTFVKDCDDPNPLIRALAIRTMGCIRLESIAEYLCTPLRKALKDEDPYVKKTAVVCVAKFYRINPEMVEQQGFITALQKLMSDSNPMVIANTVASLTEIAMSHESPSKILELTSANISKLLTCLSECTEWGQTFILDCISEYTPQSSNEAKNICERITSRLSHSNAAVVLSTCKVLLTMSSYTDDKDIFLQNLLKKMAPPLVTLLSAEPEIQYVALRNINIITQKFPLFLKNDVKAFFVKYNDPIYVKVEKLEILNRLVSEENADIVLAELKEYSSEVDVEFVRKAIRSIGRCALKVNIAADHCVKILLELIQTQINYVVQESVIVIKDIIRRYPNRYESVIEMVSASAGSIDEPEARAALIWILGEFSDNINNIGEVLSAFFDGFLDEATVVQLQLLTAIVKLFLRNPREHKDLVQDILTVVTQKCGNPDLRDRGHIYWRLLSTDSKSAKDIVLAEKPLISEQTTNLDSTLVEELLSKLATLASIYHKTPHAFIQNRTVGFKNPFASTKPAAIPKAQGANSMGAVSATNTPTSANAETVVEDLLLDLNESKLSSSIDGGSGLNISQNELLEITDVMGQLTMGIENNVMNTSQYSNYSDNMDNFQNIDFSQEAHHTIYSAPKTVLLDRTSGKGLEISGTFTYRSGILFMNLTMTNVSLGVLSNFTMAIDRNTFGIGLSPGAVFPHRLDPQQTAEVTVPLNNHGSINATSPINALRVAIQNNIDIFQFHCLIPLHFCFMPYPVTVMNQQEFSQRWDSFPSDASTQPTACVCRYSGHDLVAYLKANFIYNAFINVTPDKEHLMCFCALSNGYGFLIQIMVTPSAQQCEFVCKSNNPQIVPDVVSLLKEIFSS